MIGVLLDIALIALLIVGLVVIILSEEVKLRLINILLAFDCFMFSLLTLGKAYTSESFSSAAYRAELKGMAYGAARPFIDWLFSWLGQKEHCKYAYLSARLNLPEDMR